MRGADEARGFDGGVPGMLAAVCGTGVRHDDANVAFGDMKSVG